MTPQDLAARIDPIFAAFTRPDAPGCAVGVQRGGELLFSAGYGLASIEHQVPVAADTVFRVASVSKQFTVTAVLLLAARGRLRLDDDVRALLPELAGLPQRVTLEHLMHNNSGLPDYLELLRLGGLGLEACVGRDTMLQTIARCRHLNFAPGSRFLYCNSNFLLLGVVVERIAGSSLGEFLQREVFGPLGMDRTALVVAPDAVVPRLATPYLSDGRGGWRRATHGFEHGGEGGLVSNVPDLLTWLVALQRDSALLPGLLGQLSEPVRLSGGEASPYARGLEHSRVAGLDCVGHSGLWPGYRTELLYAPQAALGVVVISNDGSSNPYRLARQVLEELTVPAGGVAVPPRPAALEPLCGTWIGDDAGSPVVFDLALQQDEPVVTQWGLPFALQAQNDGSYLPWRSAYEFRLRVGDTHSLEVDLGLQRFVRLQRLTGRAAPDAALAGRYACADNGAIWEIVAPADPAAAWAVRVQGPQVNGGPAWPLRGLTPDLVELETPGLWMRSTQLARLERDAAGRIVALSVFSSRIRGLRFERV